MHFSSTQDLIRFLRTTPEDLRETERKKQEEQEPEAKERGKKAKDGEVLQAD